MSLQQPRHVAGAHGCVCVGGEGNLKPLSGTLRCDDGNWFTVTTKPSGIRNCSGCKREGRLGAFRLWRRHTLRALMTESHPAESILPRCRVPPPRGRGRSLELRTDHPCQARDSIRMGHISMISTSVGGAGRRAGRTLDPPARAQWIGRFCSPIAWSPPTRPSPNRLSASGMRDDTTRKHRTRRIGAGFRGAIALARAAGMRPLHS